MTHRTDPAFRPGRNIAMKVPASLHDATVAFYRDTIGLEHVATEGTTEVFAFGGVKLWVDRVDHATHAELWLEVAADDVGAGAEQLAAAGGRIVDEIEPLDGVEGHWVIDPGGTVLLVSRDA